MTSAVHWARPDLLINGLTPDVNRGWGESSPMAPDMSVGLGAAAGKGCDASDRGIRRIELASSRLADNNTFDLVCTLSSMADFQRTVLENVFAPPSQNWSTVARRPQVTVMYGFAPYRASLGALVDEQVALARTNATIKRLVEAATACDALVYDHLPTHVHQCIDRTEALTQAGIVTTATAPATAPPTASLSKLKARGLG